MRVLVDTSLWSVALKPGRSHPKAARLRHMLVTGDQIFLLGIILQEVLQGISDSSVAERVGKDLEPFDILRLERADYVEAARLYALCRSSGVTAGTVDCLIAVAAQRYDCFLFSLDQDFQAISAHFPLRLL